MLLLLGIAVPIALLTVALTDDDNDSSEGATLEGTDDADFIEGTEDQDFINGLGGDDVLIGRAGDDQILGGDGEDILEGENGDDLLRSADGNDIIMGNPGQDFIEGQGGDDFASGDDGFDTVNGGAGNDTVIGGRGGDVVEGQDGDNLVFGGILQGMPLNIPEMIALREGGSLQDINGGVDVRDDSFGNTLRGGDGDDDLILGSGDVASGNVGADTFHIMSEQNGDEAPTILDYNIQRDALTVIVDDVETDEEISVTDEGDDAIVRLGDQILARVEGRAGMIVASDVVLISEAQVEALFDPNPVAVEATSIAPGVTLT